MSEFSQNEAAAQGQKRPALLPGKAREILRQKRYSPRKKIVHEKLPDLRVVKNMHERKALIAELSDGFIALPGGYGTFEEFCEVLAWSQLGYHQKPFGLLDAAGFYRGLLEFFDHATREGFIRPRHRELVMVEDNAEQLLERLKNFQPPAEVKWVR